MPPDFLNISDTCLHIGHPPVIFLKQPVPASANLKTLERVKEAESNALKIAEAAECEKARITAQARAEAEKIIQSANAEAASIKELALAQARRELEAEGKRLGEKNKKEIAELEAAARKKVESQAAKLASEFTGVSAK